MLGWPSSMTRSPHRAGRCAGNPSPTPFARTIPPKVAELPRRWGRPLHRLGVNPVHSWPGGGFEELLRKATLSVAHSLFPDETLRACTIGLPSHHNLECWNDAAPRPGLTSPMSAHARGTA